MKMRVITLCLLCPALFLTWVSAIEPPERSPERSTDEITALIEAAAAGDTIVVPAGVYRGHLSIQKSVILDGSRGVVIDGGGEGTVVEILVPEVTFRGFTIRASGKRVESEPAGIRAETGPVRIEGNTVLDVLFGIDLRTAADSFILRNTVVGKPLEPGRRGDGIRLWWSSGCVVEDNRVTSSRDAVFWYSEGITIRGNRVTGSRYGLHFMYSHDTLIEKNVLEDNSVGVYLMYSNGITLRGNRFARNRGTSGYGVGLKDCDAVRCEDNQFLANRVGIYADRAPFSVDGEAVHERNLFAYNEVGMALTPQTVRNTIVRNTFLENQKQVTVLGRGDLEGNTFSQGGQGNYWSDYAGFDRDGDGVGDMPHHATSLFEDLLGRQPLLHLFAHSPAQQAVEFTARAMPEIRPAPKFTDPSPLMSPPAVATEGESTVRGSMLAVCLGLLAFGGTVVLIGPGWSLGCSSLSCKEVRP